jgi:hypothetical protein
VYLGSTQAFVLPMLSRKLGVSPDNLVPFCVYTEADTELFAKQKGNKYSDTQSKLFGPRLSAFVLLDAMGVYLCITVVGAKRQFLRLLESHCTSLKKLLNPLLSRSKGYPMFCHLFNETPPPGKDSGTFRRRCVSISANGFASS